MKINRTFKKIVILTSLLVVQFMNNGHLIFAQDLSKDLSKDAFKDVSYESDIEYVLTKYILAEYEEVIRLLNKYFINHQQELAYLYGLCYLKLNMNKIAIDYFSVTLKEHENNYEILNNIGAAYYQDGDYINAMKYFHLSFVSNPDYEVAQRNYNAAYGNWSSQKGNRETSPISPLIQFSEKPTMYNSLGWFYYYSGDFHNAIYYFKKSINEDAEYQFSYIALAYLYCEGNNYETALSYLKEAEKIDEKTPDLYNNMGIVYYHLSDFKNSENAFKKAISLNNQFAEPYNNLGFLYFDMDKLNLSEEYFKKSIELNLDNKRLKAESMGGLAIINFLNKNIIQARIYKESSARLEYNMNNIKYLTNMLKWTNKMIEVWGNIR
ncbi:MAG: tetratricopeptide repeat protein [Treponema sp.]|jgi:tetratricopeptide (TPR) repeat protein|nr:tetratricopeptide repeat protein [Treponema sp.]